MYIIISGDDMKTWSETLDYINNKISLYPSMTLEARLSNAEEYYSAVIWICMRDTFERTTWSDKCWRIKFKQVLKKYMLIIKDYTGPEHAPYERALTDVFYFLEDE